LDYGQRQLSNVARVIMATPQTGDVMKFFIEYWLNVWEFAKQEPVWAAAFFFCGYMIGVIYF